MDEQEAILYVLEDDRILLREIIERARSRGLVVEGYRRAWDFQSMFRPNQPGCIIADVKLPDSDGFKTYDRIRERDSKIPVILITGYASIQMAVDVMKRGATDFFEKPFDMDELLDTASMAMDGSLGRDDLFRSLTERERQVFDLVAAGHTNEAAAIELGISRKTVEAHRSKLMTKLDVKTLAELISVHQTL